MRTFLTIYEYVQSITLLAWLYFMIITPAFNKQKNRFIANWNEGGSLILLVFIVISIGASIGITKMVLLFNFLEK